MTTPAPAIRRYQPKDLAAVESICILTGDSGADATDLYTFPELLPAIFATPYVTHDPELAWVALDPAGDVAGYVIATDDVVAYDAWCEEHWWPALRTRFPQSRVPEGSPDARVIAGHLHSPIIRNAEIAAAYPAELHIDLLPSLQGLGRGRLLMDIALAGLRERGARGVHLGVSTFNENAIGFYRHLGFTELASAPGVIWFGQDLRA